MIYIGKHIQSQIICVDCGKPISNRMIDGKSAFIVCSCQNSDCESFAVGMTIEKSSMQVIAVDFVPSSSAGVGGEDRKRIYPIMADVAGNQIWPQVHAHEKPKLKFGGWRTPDEAKKPYKSNIDIHEYVDRHSPADNTCEWCGFLKEDSVHIS